MEEQTFRSRILDLLQRSRKAMRLYASMGRSQNRAAGRQSNDFSEIQAAAWQSINSDLVRRLSAALDRPQTKQIVSEVLSLREQFWNDFRSLETELHQKQQELISASESGDFVTCAGLSRDLVSIKAKFQAAQAAHHELETVIKRSKISGETIELSQERVVAEGIKSNPLPFRAEESFRVNASSRFSNSPIITGAKVIPLRKVGSSK